MGRRRGGVDVGVGDATHGVVESPPQPALRAPAVEGVEQDALVGSERSVVVPPTVPSSGSACSGIRASSFANVLGTTGQKWEAAGPDGGPVPSGHHRFEELVIAVDDRGPPEVAVLV